MEVDHAPQTTAAAQQLPAVDRLSLRDNAGPSSRQASPTPAPAAPHRPALAAGAGQVRAVDVPAMQTLDYTGMSRVVARADRLVETRCFAEALAALDSVAAGDVSRGSFMFQSCVGQTHLDAGKASSQAPVVTMAVEGGNLAPSVQWPQLDHFIAAVHAFDAAIALWGTPVVQERLRQIYPAEQLPGIIGAVKENRNDTRLSISTLANAMKNAQWMPGAQGTGPWSATDLRQAAHEFNDLVGDEHGAQLAAWTLWQTEVDEQVGPLSSIGPTGLGDGPVQIHQSQFDQLVGQVRAGAYGHDLIGGLTAQIQAMLQRNQRQ